MIRQALGLILSTTGVGVIQQWSPYFVINSKTPVMTAVTVGTISVFLCFGLGVIAGRSITKMINAQKNIA